MLVGVEQEGRQEKSEGDSGGQEEGGVNRRSGGRLCTRHRRDRRRHVASQTNGAGSPMGSVIVGLFN